MGFSWSNSASRAALMFGAVTGVSLVLCVGAVAVILDSPFSLVLLCCFVIALIYGFAFSVVLRRWQEQNEQVELVLRTFKDDSVDLSALKLPVENRLANELREVLSNQSESGQVTSKHGNAKFDSAGSDNSSLDTERTLLEQMLAKWPSAVWVFNSDYQLFYKNDTAQLVIQKPMLFGQKATELGFELNQQTLSHPYFSEQYFCQSTRFYLRDRAYILFWAQDISPALYETRKAEQQKLIRVMAHEIRNSLTPMQSMTETLLSATSYSTEQVREVCRRINIRSSNLLEFVNNYQDKISKESVQYARFEMDKVIKDIRAVLKPETKLEYVGLPVAWGDVSLITQALINLCLNSEQAMTQQLGSNITQISLSLFQKGKMQVFEVTDNCGGFGGFENLGTPLFTTKQQGTGIGLSLVNEVAKMHNGNVDYSNVEKGAKVVMTMATA